MDPFYRYLYKGSGTYPAQPIEFSGNYRGMTSCFWRFLTNPLLESVFEIGETFL